MASAPGSEQLAARLGRLLRTKSLTVSVAESCTGGMIGAALTAVPGSSQYFRGGVIAYDNAVKASLLDVSPGLLERKGAVSPEVVEAMCRGVKRLLHTDCAIAVSGVAGPTGGTTDKPVGLVCIAVAAGDDISTAQERFEGDRCAVRQSTVQRSLELLLDCLSR
jgi:PncC family amidohydrolase